MKKGFVVEKVGMVVDGMEGVEMVEMNGAFGAQRDTAMLEEDWDEIVKLEIEEWAEFISPEQMDDVYADMDNEAEYNRNDSVYDPFQDGEYEELQWIGYKERVWFVEDDELPF